MSKILRINESDYRIKVQDSGNITLDTGTATGIVRVTGNLIVEGEYTTMDVTNMTVEDNIILINKGETGSGVTEGTAGIQIQRSENSLDASFPDALLIWDESIDKFKIQTTDDALVGIVVKDIATDPTTNLEFDMQSGAGTLRITNSTGYESRVLNDNDVPNKKFVEDYVYASGGSAIVSRFKYPVSAPYGSEDSLGEALATSIKFWVRSGGFLTQRAQITANGLDVNNVNILDNSILNSSGTENLRLTSSNNRVEVDGVFVLTEQGSTPTATGGESRIFAASGATTNFELYNSGMYIYNSRTQDEIVVKNRALLLSMLF